jgi:DNA-binding Lrp family transcriptional regulator
MSAGCYLLARFDNKEKLLAAAKVLNDRKEIAGWDAVDGYYQLVVRAGGNAAETADFVRRLDGCTELARCEFGTANGSDAPPSDEPAQSYLFVEVQKDLKPRVAEALRQNPRIVSCVSTTGSFDLVAVAHGGTFDEIDRLVSDELRTLDGVLRLKQDRIIRLDRM